MWKALCLVTALAGGLVLIGACSGNVTPSATNGFVSQKIGVSGGTIVGADGEKLVIPSGTLTADTTFSVGAIDASQAPALPTGFTAASKVFAFKPYTAQVGTGTDTTVWLPQPAGGGSFTVLSTPNEGTTGTWTPMTASVQQGTANGQSITYLVVTVQTLGVFTVANSVATADAGSDAGPPLCPGLTANCFTAANISSQIGLGSVNCRVTFTGAECGGCTFIVEAQIKGVGANCSVTNATGGGGTGEDPPANAQAVCADTTSVSNEGAKLNMCLGFGR
jgi:hypothetical protein